jgi:4-amino-4-deoxychorismate lyase
VSFWSYTGRWRGLDAAPKAKIPHDFTKQGLIDIISQTVRSTGLRNCSVRYYLTAGHGGFGWLPHECVEAGFYCVVIGADAVSEMNDTALKAEKEYTVDKRFLRPQFLSQTKSNNYLLNVMCAMDSDSQGGCARPHLTSPL